MSRQARFATMEQQRERVPSAEYSSGLSFLLISSHCFTVAGRDHHFKVVQRFYNLAMPEALKRNEPNHAKRP
jgi:hypothetical protein